MSAAVRQPVVVVPDARRSAFSTLISAFSPFGAGMQQPYVVTATATPSLLVHSFAPHHNTLMHPAPIAVFHPTPAIALASSPASAPMPATVASAFTAPPSSLSALRARRVSRPAQPLRGGAELSCPNKQCGMRFASEDSLVEHLTRVHFNNRDIRKPSPIQPAVQVTYARKRHSDGSLQSLGKGQGKSAAAPGVKRALMKVEKQRVKGGKRPHAGTNGAKMEKRRRANGGKQKELNGGAHHSEDGSTESAGSSSGSESDSGSSLDSDDSIISDSDDSSGSSDVDDKGGPFERFGRAISSASDSASHSSSTSDSDSSTASSPRRTRRSSTPRRAPIARAARAPRAPRPVKAIILDSFAASPDGSAPSPPTSSRDRRLTIIHRLNYLYKYRQPLDTPVPLLRCVLCQAGLHPSLGLLLSCHGGCGLSFHQQCMELWTVPSGPWYCSDECVREECRVRDEPGGAAYKSDRLTRDVNFLQLCRRWQQWHYKKKQRAAHNKQARCVQKQRFIVPLVCTVPRCPSFPTESKWADALPPARLPAAPLVRRIFYPLSLSANPDAYINSNSSLDIPDEPAPSSIALEQQQPQSLTSSTTAATASASSNVLSSEPPRSRRPHHLIFSLKQPRSDPTDFVPTYPVRYAAKGQKQVASSRSLRTSHSSLRSAAFLLSLRVPDRDPNIAMCCVCENGDSIDDNPIILCDGPCCMAYHRHCVGLQHMPGEEEVWCCSDVCKRARQRNSTVEDDVVVRLVQKRRDEYDMRGPYRGMYDEGKNGEAANAELQEQFAQLDAQYFCPRVMARLWRKGKWRLQEMELPAMLEVLDVVGEVSGKWKVRLEEDSDGMDGQPMLAEEWIEEVASETATPPATEAASESLQTEEHKLVHGSAEPCVQPASGSGSADASMQVDDSSAVASADKTEAPSTSAPSSSVADTEPLSVIFRSASTPAALPSASHCSDEAHNAPTAASTDPALVNLNHPTPLPPTAPLALPDTTDATRPTRTTSDPTGDHTAIGKDDSAEHDVLTEEERLLASYFAQVLANNQTKSRLHAAFSAHALISPDTLHTITAKQQADEVLVQTYLEYEEKQGVGVEKDRARRQQRCHVNYCRCHACFNAHLAVEEDSEGEAEVEEEYREREADEANETLDGSQLDMEEEEAETRADDRRSATPVPVPAASSVSAALYTFPRALRPLTGSIHPPALVRFVDHCLRHRDEYLALAKSVSSADVALLLEAGGKGARTFTRQQRAKRDEELNESTRQHTRRRGLPVDDPEASPSPPPADGSGRTNTELMSLQKWGWDRTWRQRVEAGLVFDSHATRSRDRAGMALSDDVMAGGVMPRGHARLRILFRGKGVFTARDSPYDDHNLPVIRFKPRSQQRSAAHSLKLTFKRSGTRSGNIQVVDGNSGAAGSRDGKRSGEVALRFLLGGNIRVEALLNGRVGKELRRLRTGWNNGQAQQPLELSEMSDAAIGASDATIAMSATEAMSRAAALATEMVARLQAMQLEPPLLSAEERKQLQREQDKARRVAKREKQERQRVQAQQQKERSRLLRSRQVNVYVQVLADGSVVAQLVINHKYSWAYTPIGRTEIERLADAWPAFLMPAVPPLIGPGEQAAEGVNTAGEAQSAIDLDGAAEAENGSTRPHRMRHSKRHRQADQADAEQSSAVAVQASDAASTVAASSLFTLPLAATYSRKGRSPAGSAVELLPRLNPPPPPSVAAAEEERYSLDANGLPIITDPIADDICLKCGYPGDVLLCEGAINGIPCIRCIHHRNNKCLLPPITDTTNAHWFCSYHSCSSCGAADTDASSWPFTYCEWCDSSWCSACVGDEANTGGELVDWTPKFATEQARWVCCLQCVKYFRKSHRMKNGDDFRAPQRQLRAHEQKVKGQLTVLRRMRKQQEKERRALEGLPAKRARSRKSEDDGTSERKRPATEPQASASKRRKSEGGIRFDKSMQLAMDREDALLKNRRSSRATKRKAEQAEQEVAEAGVKSEGQEQQSDADEQHQSSQPLDYTATNGVHLSGGAASTPSTDTDLLTFTPSPARLELQPCISRSEQSSTRRQLRPVDRAHSKARVAVARDVDEGEETDEETPTLVKDTPPSKKERQAAGQLAALRNGERGEKRAVATNGLNGHASPTVTVTVPSPSSLASLPCLSTSSSASTSSSPLPLLGTPDSLGSEAGVRSSLQLLSPPSPQPLQSLDAGEFDGGRRRSTRRGNAIEHAEDRRMAKALYNQLNGWTVRGSKVTLTPRKRAAAAVSPAKGDKMPVESESSARVDGKAEDGAIVPSDGDAGGFDDALRSGGRARSKRLRAR